MEVIVQIWTLDLPIKYWLATGKACLSPSMESSLAPRKQGVFFPFSDIRKIWVSRREGRVTEVTSPFVRQPPQPKIQTLKALSNHLANGVPLPSVSMETCRDEFIHAPGQEPFNFNGAQCAIFFLLEQSFSSTLCTIPGTRETVVDQTTSQSWWSRAKKTLNNKSHQ